MMKNINSNKGITLTILVITIIILLILTSTVIYNISSADGVESYNNMVADVELLKDKILLYYNTNKDIPKTTRQINVNGTEYYEIDLHELGYITLNYGSEFGQASNLTNTSDVYVVNDLLDVYYLKGVKMSDEIYHD